MMFLVVMRIETIEDVALPEYEEYVEPEDFILVMVLWASSMDTVKFQSTLFLFSIVSGTSSFQCCVDSC